MLRKIYRYASNEKAFTLIEVIVSLVLIGIMAAIAGMGLMKIAEGYVFAKQNTETAQKSQIAMARIVKELSAAEKASGAASAITAIAVDSVTYTRPGPVNNTIEITSGGLVQITGTTPGTLMNNVVKGSSSFTYYDGMGATTTVLPSIRRIDIRLTVLGASGSSSEVNNTVFVQGSY